jgi:hypothetical protein
MMRSASSLVRLSATPAVYVLDALCIGSTSGKGLHSDGGQSKLRPHLQSLCDEYVGTLTWHLLYSHLSILDVG